MPVSLRLAAIASAPLMILLAAACSGDASGDQEELTTALGELTSTVQHLGEETSALSAAASGLEVRVETLGSGASDLGFDGSRVGPSRAVYLPPPPEGLVTVQFLAEDVNAAVPGDFEFYLAPEGSALFTTESLAPGTEPPVGQKLEDGIVFVEPGVLYSLQVVYRNPVNEPLSFLVPGGTLDPQAALPFVRNRCWCAAIPFTAGAGETWYRTIEVGVGSDTPPGAKALVIWPVVVQDA